MNNLKTTILLGVLTGLVLFLGYKIGGEQGLFLGLVISFAMNISSYWFSDKIVLSMYKAKEVSQNDNPNLYSVVSSLAREAEIPMPKLYIIDLPVPNAFATGRNKDHSAVAVSNSILNTLSEDELRGVLAHELGHIKHNDILTSTIAGMLAGTLSYLSHMMLFSRNNEDRGGVSNILFIVFTPLIASLLHMAISRSREFAADEYSAKLTKNPESLVSALQKISSASRSIGLVPSPSNEATAHLFISNPFKPSLLSNLFSTHPSLEARIEKLRSIKI
jgi:heat shock protein HtpX